MKIDMTPQLQSALLNRVKAEFTETAMANFALDMICDDLISQVKNLNEQNQSLSTRNRSLMDQVEEMTRAKLKARKPA